MLVFRTTGRFEKEFRLAVKRGKDVSKLQAATPMSTPVGDSRADGIIDG